MGGPSLELIKSGVAPVSQGIDEAVQRADENEIRDREESDEKEGEMQHDSNESDR